jgi:predicted AAA+ superfamily ATPase
MVYIKREIERELIKWLESREIIAIRGARQSGKTTLLMRIKEILNNNNVDDDRIHYISFEDDIIRLKFEENVKEFIEFHLTSKKKHYFLLDEVQYIKDAGKKLKLIFDSFSNIKIFITGSSSFDLTNLGSYLVGRIIFFNLYPFSFGEFLKSKDEKYEKLYRKIKVDLRKEITIEKTVFLDELNKLLHEYLTYGSYPRIILEKNQDKKKELLRNLFITYVEKDIVGMYGIKYREKVVKLLKAIAYTSGNVINYETLSTNSDLKYHNVREILPLLEDSFVISIVRPFHKNLMNELRKNPKIYFLDYGIRNYLLETFDNIRFDYLYETFVHNELKRSYQVKYWRTTAKTEVDFVVLYKDKIVPLEVKIKPKITRSFRSFIQHYNPNKALILNLNILDKKNIDNCNIFMLPFVYI